MPKRFIPNPLSWNIPGRLTGYRSTHRRKVCIQHNHGSPLGPWPVLFVRLCFCHRNNCRCPACGPWNTYGKEHESEIGNMWPASRQEIEVTFSTDSVYMVSLNLERWIIERERPVTIAMSGHTDFQSITWILLLTLSQTFTIMQPEPGLQITRFLQTSPTGVHLRNSWKGTWRILCRSWRTART